MDQFLDVALPFTIGPSENGPGGEEGGLSDDPRDPGGITNMGLTIPDLTRWFGRRAHAIDVRNLTREQAVPIYRVFYWKPIHGDELPPGVSLLVFDHGVNRGVGTSARILQEVLGFSNADPDPRRRIDGDIGPITLGATLDAVLADVNTLLHRLYLAQRDDYLTLQSIEPEFEDGWLGRSKRRYEAACYAAGVQPHK